MYGNHDTSGRRLNNQLTCRLPSNDESMTPCMRQSSVDEGNHLFVMDISKSFYFVCILIISHDKISKVTTGMYDYFLISVKHVCSDTMNFKTKKELHCQPAMIDIVKNLQVGDSQVRPTLAEQHQFKNQGKSLHQIYTTLWQN